MRIRELEWQVGRLSDQLSGRFCYLNNCTTANVFLTERHADLDRLLDLELRRLIGSYARMSELNRCASEVYAGVQGPDNKELVKELYLKVDELQNQLGLAIRKHRRSAGEESVREALVSMRERWTKSWAKTDTVEGFPAPKRQRRD